MTHPQAMDKARILVATCISPLSKWTARENIIETIAFALLEAEKAGMMRTAEIVINIPSISLGGDTYETVSQIAQAILKEAQHPHREKE